MKVQHDFACPVWIGGLHIADIECRARFTVSPHRPARPPSFASPGEPAEGGEIETLEVFVLGNKPDPAVKGNATSTTFLGMKSGHVRYVQTKKPALTPGQTSCMVELTEFETPVPDWLEPHVAAYLDRYQGDFSAAAVDADPDDGRADHEYERCRDARMEAAE